MIIQVQKYKHAFQLGGLSLAMITILYLGLLLFIQSKDPQVYSDTFKTALEKHIAGEVQITGTRWNIFPIPHLYVERAKFNSESEDTLAVLRQISLEPKLWSLLSGHVSLRQVEAKELEVFIDTKNTTNQHLKHLYETRIAQQQDWHTNVDRIVIQHSKLNITASSQQFSFSGPQLQLSNIRGKKPQELSVIGPLIIHRSNNPAITGEASFQVKFKKQDDALEIISTTGELSWPTTESIHATTVSLEASGEYEFATDNLMLAPFNVTMNNAHIKASLIIEKALQNREIILTIPEQTPHIGGLLTPYTTESAGMEYTLALIDSMKINGHIIANKNEVAILLTVFEVDAHPGSLDISYNFQSKQWQSELDLAYLDIRPMLTQTKSTKITGTKVTKTDLVTGKDLTVPIETLKQLFLHQTIAIGTVVHPYLEARNMRLTLTVENGKLTISPAQFSAYNGKVSFEVTLDTTTSPPQFTMLQNSEQIEIGELQANTIQQRWLTGLIDNKLQVTGTGDTFFTIKRSLEGTLHVKLKLGHIHTANLQDIAYKSAKTLTNVLNRAARKSFLESKTMELEGTTVQDVFANFSISNEKITAQKVFARLNNELSAGDLSYDHKTQNLIYTTPISIPSTIPDLSELQWPLSCVIEKWALPRCGIYAKDARKSIAALTNRGNSVRPKTSDNIESSTQTTNDSLMNAFKNMR